MSLSQKDPQKFWILGGRLCWYGNKKCLDIKHQKRAIYRVGGKSCFKLLTIWGQDFPTTLYINELLMNNEGTKYLADEISRLLADMRWKNVVNLTNSLVCCIFFFALKWRFSDQEFVAKNTDSPVIDLKNEHI